MTEDDSFSLYPEKTNRLHGTSRLDAAAALQRMGYGSSQDYTYLRRILGYPDDEMLRSHFTEEDYNTCKQLAGPHGYTIFRMLCLKHGIKDLAKTCEEPQNLPQMK